MPTIKLEKRYPHIADEDVTEIFNAGYLQGWENARSLFFVHHLLNLLSHLNSEARYIYIRRQKQRYKRF